MPLSKARDKQRKRKERAKSRLDNLLCPPRDIKTVQPKPIIDADGNVIPEYD